MTFDVIMYLGNFGVAHRIWEVFMEPVLRDDAKYTVKDIKKLPEGKRAE